MQGKKSEGLWLHPESEVIFQRILGEVIILNGAGYTLRESGSYCNLPENPEGSEGLCGRSPWERAGAQSEGGQCALRAERSGGQRSGVGEGNTRNWDGHR